MVSLFLNPLEWNDCLTVKTNQIALPRRYSFAMKPKLRHFLNDYLYFPTFFLSLCGNECEVEKTLFSQHPALLWISSSAQLEEHYVMITLNQCNGYILQRYLLPVIEDKILNTNIFMSVITSYIVPVLYEEVWEVCLFVCFFHLCCYNTIMTSPTEYEATAFLWLAYV